ncbi:hypothetical protein L602_000800001340 [Cupriavidus gilardii J11]|uniref:Uncharacterized protein n=1 Tax=Cupriavidus gilardii J11 TaxID=936133 RepID=A0A562B1M1_9BURK|nr:hypothetical protein [Cupriavidus gilardii]TWG79065.1 hypothetical protein L602_000800001340 [Cupriavidus gilardii J11]
MRTPASIHRHLLHPMLIPVPIRLWLFSFVCDLVRVPIALLAASGWLGGKMVYEHGVGVDLPGDR